jgi:hypothetical protein
MIVDIVVTMIVVTVDIMMVDIVGTLMVAAGMTTTTTIMIITTIIMVMINMLRRTGPCLARPSREGRGKRLAGRPADLGRPRRRPRPDGLTLCDHDTRGQTSRLS